MNPIHTEDFTIATAQGQIHARRWRNAEAPPHSAPFVLLHDSLGAVSLWREFPEQLARQCARDVVAYDRLGFGESSPHPGLLATSFIRDESQQALAAVLTHLGIEPFIAVGHSVGGGMALCAAAQYPQRCLGVITLAAQSYVEQRTIDGLLTAKQAFAEDGQMQRLARYHGDKAPWVLQAWLGTWLSPAFADWTLDEDLRRLQCPLLVFHGDQDEYGSTEHPHRIAALAGGKTTVQVLEGCGHVPHRERMDEVLTTVVVWLRGLDD